MTTHFTLRLRRDNGLLECELTVPESMQITSLSSIKLTEKSRKNILRHYVAILRLLRKKSEPDITVFKRELRELGKKIGKVLRKIISGLAIDTAEDVELALALDETTVDIPWELALVKERPRIHLCEKMNVGRLRVVKEDSWIGTSRGSRRKSRRALVVGIDYKDRKCRPLGELDWAEREAESVRSILEGNDLDVTFLPGKKATKKRIERELKRGVEIFHFSGHGTMERGQSKIEACDQSLSTNDLDNILGNDEYAPTLSFLNACETSIERDTIGENMWEAYNWADALARCGGKVFIGTLWPIFEGVGESEKEALLFPARFYKTFLGYKAGTLAESMRQARLEIKSMGEDEMITSWPAYVLYGSPWLLSKDFLT